MTETMQQINLNQLDKSTWQKYRFEQIAKSITERVDPNNTDLDVYIGLEHIDAESIHIKRTGTRDDVNGQKLRCYPGDVIFGRRRAYQRKAAIATVDGFCSAHSLVLRANADVIDPKLFPFFLHSDAFMHRAIDISVGSLSPTINWGTLKHQEFLLPPKDQQAKLAELLWAMDEVVEKELRLKEVLKSTRQNLFENRVNYADGELVALSDVLEIKNLKSSIPHSRTRYIGLENIESGAFYCNDYSDSSSVKAQCNSVDKGDLCYSKLRPYLDKAFIASFDAVSSTELLVYKTNRMSKEYVLYYLHSKPFIDYVSGKGFGTKMPRVNHEIIGEFLIKIIKDELGLLEELAKFQKSEYELTVKIESAKLLQKSLINQIF